MTAGARGAAAQVRRGRPAAPWQARRLNRKAAFAAVADFGDFGVVRVLVD
jgi:hypothetical protein